jgi:hypothetical protein
MTVGQCIPDLGLFIFPFFHHFRPEYISQYLWSGYPDVIITYAGLDMPASFDTGSGIIPKAQVLIHHPALCAFNRITGGYAAELVGYSQLCGATGDCYSE